MPACPSGTNLGTAPIPFIPGWLANVRGFFYSAQLRFVPSQLRPHTECAADNRSANEALPGTARRYQISALTTIYHGCLSTSESASCNSPRMEATMRGIAPSCFKGFRAIVSHLISSHLATRDEMRSKVLEHPSALSTMQRAKRRDRELS